MKKTPVFSALAATLLLGACLNTGETPKIPPEEKNPALPAAGSGGGGNGLDRAAFRELGPETRSCLEALSRAFTNRDREYLLSQGEENYEAAVRPYYDEGSYLAMLYRAGAYATDSLRDKGRRPFLEPGEIAGVEYLDWEEQGPMLVIRGRLMTKAGALPCKIVLAWRLRTPKILGVYP
ncbi:MAG: hypothetical protein LBR93_09525 [Treponema sp.]|nr:hypothetical protein [Treponema sp.]